MSPRFTSAAMMRFTFASFKAVVAVLKKYPDFNSSLDNQGEHLIRKQYYHIGIAVETQDGLMVPVLKNADQKGVNDIAIELQALAS